jgi:Tol biopolymer transport system component
VKQLIYIIIPLLLAAITASSQQSDSPKLTGPYIGQTTPGTTPEKFAPGIVSTEAHEYACSFSPDGSEFYFTRNNSVNFTKLVDGVWTEPKVVSFSGDFSFEPSVTPDNKRLYFQSAGMVKGKMEMMTKYVERVDAGWSEVIDPGAPFNPGRSMHISATMDGTIYTTNITGGMGSESLGIIKKVNGSYEKLENLGTPFNKAPNQQHPWIAPDESYIVFTERKPGQNSVSTLFCSFRNKKDGTWSEPVELKLGMDAGQPFVSFDGKYLFFSTGNPRVGSDIYWVSAKVIEDLRPKE